MTSECTRLRRLILVEEELGEQELAEARRHLQACPACRALRARVLAVEDAVRSVAALPETPDPLASSSEVERVQARDSLAALLAAQETRPPRRWRRAPPLALAAVVALAVILPVLQLGSPVRDLRVGSPLVLRGDAETPAGGTHGVSFRLKKSGYPVLVHIDGDGAARLIHPAAGAPPALLAKDRLVLLPPGEEAVWRADLAAGPETYLLAVATKGPPDREHLQALLPVAAGSRQDAIRAVTAQLSDAVGKVSRCDDPSVD